MYLKVSINNTFNLSFSYKDVKNNIQDLIPVSQSVMEYIILCTKNGIEPTLGIRIRNGQISSLVKYKNKFIVK